VTAVRDRDSVLLVAQQRCVVQMPPPRGSVQDGEVIGRVQTLPWPALRCVLPADLAACVPARVRVQIQTQMRERVGEFYAMPLRAPRGVAETNLWLPLPDRAEGWQPGAAFDVALFDDTAARRVLAAPRDCVARLGQATEVLVHTGPGQLTRRSVVVGMVSGDQVEIVAGLVAGETLVRQLETRMRWFPRFMAAMVGVWTPAHQEAALLRLVDER